MLMPVNVVSLFSGGGGLDLGFKNAGYNILWAIDNNQDAVNTYKVNIGEHIICADINKIDEVLSGYIVTVCADNTKISSNGLLLPIETKYIVDATGNA